MFKLVVAGGRDFSDYDLLKCKLDRLLANKKDIVIVCGGAKGADALGEKYAMERGYIIQYFLADWDTHGKSAGYKRNKQMAMNSDATVAFWDGKSKGTKHMIDLTKTYGNALRVIKYNL